MSLPTNHYANKLAFSPQKTHSTLYTNVQNSAESKYNSTVEHDYLKANSLLQVQSHISFGESKIKRQEIISQISQPISTITIENNSFKVKSSIKSIDRCSLRIKQKEQKLTDIKMISSAVQNKMAFLRLKSQKKEMRRKQYNRSINNQISMVRNKLQGMKNLSYDSHSNKSYNSTQRANKSCSYKHRRLNTEQASRKTKHKSKQQQPPIFLPIYLPYPVFQHYNHHTQRPHYPVSYNSVNLHPRLEHYQLNQQSSDRSFANSPLNNFYQIQQIQQKSSKIKQFSSRLKESLTHMQSPKASRKQSQKFQRQQSIRNSRKSSTSKSQVKPKLNKKTPFQTQDQGLQEQQERGSILAKNQNYSKMGIKITSSNTCEEQPQQFNKNKKEKIMPFQKIMIVEQLSNSSVNLQIPSDKRQNSSWQKDTIERLKLRETRNSGRRATEKYKFSDKSQIEIQIAQPDPVSSSLDGSDINIALTESPVKELKNTPKLSKAFSSQESHTGSIQTIKPKNDNKKQQQKNQVKSYVQIFGIPSQAADQDIIGSITLMAESKISRNSLPKPKAQEKKIQEKEDEDQMLGMINLAPESRISRLSRQKATLKASRSEFKSLNTQPVINVRTSVSDIRQTLPQLINYNVLVSSFQGQKSNLQYETELRTTTPSRIIKKATLKPKSQFKSNINLNSGSIQEASQEEEGYTTSQIMLKMGKKSNQKRK